MNTFKWLSFLLLFLTGCANNNVKLDDFDHTVWRNDQNACEGRRASLKESLLRQREKLLGLDEMEMVETLGKPDQQEIYKRNEKFFYYFLSPARGCPEPASVPERLVIRFNAVGLAKEISVE